MSYRIRYGKEEKKTNYLWLLIPVLVCLLLTGAEELRQTAVEFYLGILMEAGYVP